MLIINIRHYKNWAEVLKLYPNAVYIGRANSYKGVSQSPLYNPKPLYNEAERLKNIAEYRAYLETRILWNDPEITAAMRALDENSVLVCWCAPLPCHGNAIVELWQKYFA